MTTQIKVDGMSCAHCAAAVKKAALSVRGMIDVSVDLKTKTVDLTHDNASMDEVKAAIEDQGYDVTN